MSNLPWIPRINATRVVTATPTITASSAYAAGNQLGGIMQLTDIMRQDSNAGAGTSQLVGVTILDKDKQDSPIDLWLFNQPPTVTSTDHAAFAMTAANLASQCIGVVQVGASGKYSDAAAVSVSSDVNLNKIVMVPGTATSPTSIYAIAVARGTPTYTTTTSLQFRFEFFLD